MRLLLDREHDAPLNAQAYEVTAPYELDSHASVEWALRRYGDLAHTIECMGRWNEDGSPSRGYVFRVTPKSGGE